jgi:hypothetical protein
VPGAYRALHGLDRLESKVVVIPFGIDETLGGCAA